MVGHLKLYRSVLHHPENSLPIWFLEAVGVYTSLLNECVYSYTHHFANMKRLLEDPRRSKAIEEALRDQLPEKAFSGNWSRSASSIALERRGSSNRRFILAKWWV
jgi:hypothetical protein